MRLRRKLALLAKTAVFFVGAYFSTKQVSEFLYVGLIFAVVVLVWRSESIQDLINIRNGMFIVCSTLIYALVVWIVQPGQDMGWRLYAGVAVGTSLLPVTHVLFLGSSWKRALIAIPCVYSAWYLVGMLLLMNVHLDDYFKGIALFNKIALSHLVDNLVNFVSVWQGSYLICMFAPKPVFLKRP